MSLRAKLILMFFMITALSLSVVAYLSYEGARHTLVAKETEAMSGIAQSRKQALETLLNLRIQQVQMLSSKHTLKNIILREADRIAGIPVDAGRLKADEADFMQRELIEWKNIATFYELTFTDSTGLVVLTNGRIPLGTDLRGDARFRRGMHEPFHTDVFIDANTGKQAFTTVVPIMPSDGKGRPIGVSMATMGTTVIQSLVSEKTGLGETGEVLLGQRQDSSLFIISTLRHASAPDNISWQNENALPIKEAVDGKSGAAVRPDYRGEPVIAAWKPIEGTHWGLVAKKDTKEAFASVAVLQQQIMVVALFMFGLSILVAVVWGNRITRPLQQITRAFNDVALGKTVGAIPLSGKDEVGQLASAFNKLRDDLNRLNDAISKTNTGIWSRNLTTGQIFWDPSMYVLYGLSKGDLDGNTNAWEKVMHEEDLPRVEQELKEALKGNKDFDTRFRVQRPDGKEYHIRSVATVERGKDGRAVKVKGTDWDVTALTEKEAYLQKVLQELDQQVRCLNEAALVSATDPEGNIVFVNDKFCKISGYTEKELLGQNHRILKSGMQPNGLFKGMWAAIGAGRIWNGEILNKRKDGTLYWVDTTIMPFKDVSGKIDKYLAIRFDITEQKSQHERLKKQTDELSRTNKELEAFSYSVSHDLKAPLRALQGFSKNIIDRYGDKLDETGNRWLGFIETNAERMDSLIGNILSFSRISRAELKMDEVDMSKLANEAYEDQRSEYEQPIVFHVQDLPNCKADRNMLRLVWQNLIGNAMKYSREKEQAIIDVTGKEEFDAYVYSVTDNGAGFDMRHYDKLFGIFQRLHADDEFEGTGVGLATVQRIVIKHGGTIEAESELGQGATFQFSIPKT